MNFEEDFKLLAERMNEDIYKLFKDMDGQKFETYMSAITPNTYLGFLSSQIEEPSDLQHRNGFVGHTFSLKAEGMFANQGGSVCAGMSCRGQKKS